jgi:hypothetical protein
MTRSVTASWLIAILMSIGCSTEGSAAVYFCTVKDVVEITPIGTLGRRPALTQAEMTLQPSFAIDTATGILRGARPDLDGQWRILDSRDAPESVIIDVAVGSPEQSPSHLLRIRSRKGSSEGLFLWFSPTNVKTGSCESEGQKTH